MATRQWRYALAAAGGAAAALAFALVVVGPAPVAAGAPTPPAVRDAGASYVYRFNPSGATFVFTFTLPADYADPADVLVIAGAGSQEVWITESGANTIGRLTFTDTSHYSFHDYALIANSQPLNLTSGGGFVWFTAPGRDYIGRLDPTTGQIDRFQATAGCYPADLAMAPDGSIWFTEMMADRISRLVVTSTTDYAITRYSHPLLSGGRPYGIVVRSGTIWVAQTAGDRVTQFTPPATWVHVYVPGLPDEPFQLVPGTTAGVWGTERAGNRISYYDYGTFAIINPHSLSPSGSRPWGLAIDASGRLWFTQWAAGRIGRLIPGVPAQRDYYSLPLPSLAPTGIAVDSAGMVWAVASYRPHVYLPIVIKGQS